MASLEKPCLGHPFKVGMLYNSYSDRLLPGMFMWDQQTLTKASKSKPQVCYSTSIEVSTEFSDNMDSRCAQLGVDNDLKLSILSGLVVAKRSAEYLYHSSQSTNQARVCLKCESTSVYEHIDLQSNQMQTATQFGGLATHVVTALLYGVDAYFVFDSNCATAKECSEVQSKLERMLNQLSENSDHDSSDLLQIDCQCKYYGDIKLTEDPKTFKDAVNTYKGVQKLFSEKKSIPKRAWLSPLNSPLTVFSPISMSITTNLQYLSEELQSVLEAHADLDGQELLNKFPSMKEHVTEFGKCIGTYKRGIMKQVQGILPLVRKGEKKEVELSSIIALHQNSPFRHRNLKIWIDQKQKEIKQITSMLEQIQNIIFVPSSDKNSIDSLIFCEDYKHVVCFAFNIIQGEDAFLDCLAKNQFQSDNHSQNHWCNNIATNRLLVTKFHQFRLFVKKNSRQRGIKFLATDIIEDESLGNLTNKPVILLYENGRPLLFEPPGKPGKLSTQNVTQESVQLLWTKPEQGADFITNYKVLYQCSTDLPDAWKELKTKDAKETVVIRELSSCTPYVFKVEAVCTAGMGQQSDNSELVKTKERQILSTKPGRPTATSISSNKVRLEWTEPECYEHVKYYSVFYRSSQDPPDQWKEERTRRNEPNIIILGLLAKATYFFKVRPQCEGSHCEESDYSEPFQTKQYLPGKPGTPAALKITDTSVQLQWYKSESNAELTSFYTVYYRSINDPKGYDQWNKETTVGSTETLTINFLQAEQTYVFKVRSECAIGSGPDSDLSSKITTKASPICKPGKPMATRITSNSITIEWKKSKCNEGSVKEYTVFYHSLEDIPDQWRREKIGGNQSSITIHGLVPESCYLFKVRAESENGFIAESVHSEPIPTHKLVCDKPGKPEAVSITDTSVSLKWETKNCGNTSDYTVLYQYHSYSTNVWMIGGDTEDNTFTVYNLSPFTEYVFKITANCKDRKRIESDVSDAVRTEKTIPGKPSKPQSTDVTESSIKVQWKKPDHGTHLIKTYKVSYRAINDPPERWISERTSGKQTIFSIHGLHSQCKYFVKVCPESEHGLGIESDCSEPICTKAILPGQPGTPTALSVTSNSIKVQWSKPQHNAELVKFYVVSYRLCKDPPDNWNNTNNCDENTDMLTINSLQCKEEYAFKVCAHCQAGKGPDSDISHPIKTKPAVPGKPGKPRAIEITVNSIRLEWTKPQYNANMTTAYRILYRHARESSEHWKEEQTDDIQQTLNICGLAAKSEYIFKVCPLSEDGFGSESDESDIIRTHPILPGKPGKPIATDVTSDSIRIEWIKPQSNAQLVTHYTILYRSSFDPANTRKEKRIDGTKEFATLCSLRSKSVYFIKVRSESEDGPGEESECSEPIYTKPTMPGKPGKPESLERTSNSIHIKWKMPESNAELTKFFTIFYCLAQSHQDKWKEENTREVIDNFILGSLVPNQEYIFKVCPISEIGPGPESDISDPIRTKPLTPGKPGKPLPKSITSDAIHLEWSQPNLHAHVTTSYTISYCSASNPLSEWKNITSEKNAVVLHNLSPNSTYLCKVCPESDGGPGIVSDTSDPIQTKPLLPGNPGALKVREATDTTISLEWTKPVTHPKTVTSYTILYQTDGSKWKEQQTNSSKELTMTLKDLKAKTEYTLKVRPESKQGHGMESNEIKVKTKPHVPGKPTGKLIVAKTGHNHLWLSWKPPSKFSELVITYRVFYSTDKQQWLSIKTLSAEPKISIPSLAPETKYFIKIQAEGADGSGPESDISEASTKITLAECMRKESQLMDPKGQNPKVYLVPTKRLIVSNDNKIAKCSIKKIKNSKNDKGEKVLMIVGGTGAGKTTLINGFVNYILGVQWQDNFRFKLIAEGEDGKKDQAHSQTKWITAYNIQAMEDSSTPYAVTIIDTPGFGDTEGIERDKQLVTQIREFFSIRDGIDQIHAIGFVVQASMARLTPTQKYIFDSILSLFGKDIGNIIFMMITFADAKEPPVLKSLAANDIKYNGYFKFNNSALYTSAGASTKGFDQLFWELGMDSFKTFFNKLDEVEPQSLTLTKAVLEERKRLETIVNGLQPQITAGLNKIEEIRAEEKILRDKESEILRNKDFEYEINVTKQRKIDLEVGKYVTNCLECNYTCHYPCIYSNDADKFKCSAMDGGGSTDAKCKVCPGKCHWTKHVNNPYRFELYQEVEHRTSADLKLRYDQAKEGKTNVESMIENLHKELKDMETLVLFKVRDARECLNRLDEIALKPDPLNEVDYIDVLIESEKKQSNPGFSERIKALEELKNKAQIVKDLKEPTATSGKWWHKLWPGNWSLASFHH